jgi:hypothetical protein
MDLIQDIHPILEHELTLDELVNVTNFAIMIIRERTDDSISFNMSTKQISALTRVTEAEPSAFRQNYEKRETVHSDRKYVKQDVVPQYDVEDLPF